VEITRITHKVEIILMLKIKIKCELAWLLVG